MGRPKLEKFAELDGMDNVFQKDGRMKGKWREDFFHNSGRIILELACGKGEYTRALAARFPQDNFIGVDIKGNRLWSGNIRAREEGLTNVAFIRDQIDHLQDYFEEGEVSEIWITFPDPFIKKSKSKKRLTAPKFLDIYRVILAEGGMVHLKTDSPVLFDFTLQVLKERGEDIIDVHEDIYEEGVEHKTYGIRTYYENMHLKDGRRIKFISFHLKK